MHDEDPAGPDVQQVLVIDERGAQSQAGKRLRDNSNDIELEDSQEIVSPPKKHVVPNHQYTPISAPVILKMVKKNILDWKDIMRLAQVNTHYRNATRQDPIWIHLLGENFEDVFAYYAHPNGQFHPLILKMLDRYTPDMTKRGQNYYKRFFEFLKH